MLESVDSTNTYAKALLSKSKPLEGTAIIARAQTQGRGQIGNTWHTEPGKNLTVSIILYPVFLKAAEQAGLTQAVALAVKDTATKYLNEPVHIKWPNDIYCNNQKLAGILVENTISGQNLSDSVIGVGLNVNQTEFGEMSLATSLLKLGGTELEVTDVAMQLFSNLEKRYLQLKNGNHKALKDEYTSNMFRLKEWHEFKTVDTNIQGKVLGVNAFGQLEMETSEGIRYFNNKEVEWVI